MGPPCAPCPSPSRQLQQRVFAWVMPPSQYPDFVIFFSFHPLPHPSLSCRCRNRSASGHDTHPDKSSPIPGWLFIHLAGATCAKPRPEPRPRDPHPDQAPLYPALHVSQPHEGFAGPGTVHTNSKNSPCLANLNRRYKEQIGEGKHYRA